MDSTQLNNAANVETVEIEEPSDKVQVLNDEKTCLTRKHLYIIVGVLLVAAIALIGTLLGFSSSSPGNTINQQTLRAGVSATFPMFDTNNDGKIDQEEMSNWMSAQMASCKKNCQGSATCDPSCGVHGQHTPDPNTNGSAPVQAEVNGQIAPCDYNNDGCIDKEEMNECVLTAYVKGGSSSAQPETSAKFVTEASPCGSTTGGSGGDDDDDGIAGWTHDGKVAACREGFVPWCYQHIGCQDHDNCGRYYLPAAASTTNTCCGQGAGANCTGCTCGRTYTIVPAGHHPNTAKWCHKLADWHCGRVNTGCKSQ